MNESKPVMLALIHAREARAEAVAWPSTARDFDCCATGHHVDCCEFCGQPGCHWSRHPEALRDVRLDTLGKLPGWEPWRGEPRHEEGRE